MAATPALDFVLFHVADLGSALAFFSEKLGCARVLDEDAPGFHFLRGGHGVDFGLAQVHPGGPAAGTVQVYFKTADLEGARAALLRQQVDAAPIVSLPFGPVFDVGAPDGFALTMLGAV